MNMKYELETEVNTFSGTKSGCSGNFQKILGIAINNIFCENKLDADWTYLMKVTKHEK